MILMKMQESAGISYLQIGRTNRPAIVLLHGLGGDHTGVLALGRLLSKHYLVYMPDLPGHGLSRSLRAAPARQNYAKALTRFVQSLGLKRFIMIGHSYGSAIALEYAVSSEVPPKLLVLLAPYPRYRLNVANVAASVGVNGIAHLPDPWPHKLMGSQLFSDIGGGLLLITKDRSLRTELTRSGREASAKFDITTARGISEDMRRFDAAELLEKVKCPTYVVYGDKDRFGGFGEVHKELQNPQVEVQLLQGQGHLFPLENPKLTDGLVTKWLQDKSAKA